jgi:hypothetical protein
MEMVISGTWTGSGKLCIPARSLPVCRSGTPAMRSEAGESQSGREATDDRDDLAFESEGLQGLVDRPLGEAAPRDEDRASARIAGGRDLTSAERVPQAHDADEAVAEQGLRAHFLRFARNDEVSRRVRSGGRGFLGWRQA